MKILIISDIHANFEALNKIDRYIKECEIVICLGDILGYYCQVNEVISYLKDNSIICIQGNHDNLIMNEYEQELNDSVKFGIEYARKVITKENVEWLKNLPLVHSIKYDNFSILGCHGSPWNYLNEYLYEDKIHKRLFNDFNYNLILCGHTHRPLYKKLGPNKIFINPGSIGQSRDIKNIVQCKIFDTESSYTQAITIPYSPNKVLELALENGAGDWIFKHH